MPFISRAAVREPAVGVRPPEAVRVSVWRTPAAVREVRAQVIAVSDADDETILGMTAEVTSAKNTLVATVGTPPVVPVVSDIEAEP